MRPQARSSLAVRVTPARALALTALVVPSTFAFIACGTNPRSRLLSPGDAAPDATAAPPLPDAAPADDAALDSPSSCGEDASLWTDPGVAAPTVDPTLAGQTHHFFKISVVDTTDAAVVGATLTTTNATVYTTDENGLVAYYEPGLMGTSVYFSPSCPGYSYPADGLQNVGVALSTSENGSGVITMTKSGTPVPTMPGNLATRLLAGAVPGPAHCFALRFTDSTTMRGVPLVKAVSAAGDEYWSDSQGLIAYCDPDFVGQSVTFTVTSDGYALSGGTSLTVATSAGGSQTIPVVRVNVAERLYRVTGEGIYRDSVLLGLTTPVAHPNINGLVMGQDTPSTNLYEGQIYWIWQDTDRAAYPLGNFLSSGAVSTPASAGGLSPDLGIDTAYFVDSNGFSRAMVDTTETPPVWLGGLVNVLDPQGNTKMYGSYCVACGSDQASNELGVFNDSTSQFDFVADYAAGAVEPGGRPVLVNEVVNGTATTYAYWSNPVRFPATVAGVEAIASYEVFSAYGADGGTTLAENADGTLAYQWSQGAAPVTSGSLADAGVGSDQLLDGHVTDIASGGSVQVAHDPLVWNDYRKRFGKIIQQQFGSPSFLGETWYAEGDTPLGPWVFARKVVTYEDGYTFYNPDIVPYFAEADGRILFFDATYTTYLTNLTPTPRYNYNELMYRLDLDDPRVVLPVAVYTRGTGAAQEPVTKRGVRPGDSSAFASFFAYDRVTAGAVPLAWNGPSCAARRITVGGTAPTTPLFYALAPNAGVDAGAASVPPTVPLYEYAGAGGAYVYSADPGFVLTGFQRGAVIAEVWPSPIRVALPVADFLGDLVADAGPDQCVAAPEGGVASVPLDGTASRDLAGAITSYIWKDATTSCTIATGAQSTVALSAGVHDLRLEVADAAGNTSSDEVIVAVGGQ